MDVYPLLFKPIFKPKLWGGRRLETMLNKRLPAEARIGESWELAGLESDQSVVANGPARGRMLHQMVEQWGPELTGRAPLVAGRFPLLLKFIDANETLSVQVHPDEAAAERSGGRTPVKHEAWYVIDAPDDGFIYRGLREGVDRDEFRQAVESADRERIESTLQRIPVRKGHCYFLPSGTPHALGAGVLVAEVQTPSDVTYRLFDWNRIDPATGSPRELHAEQALESMRFDPVPPETERRQHVASVWTAVTSLVRCESFTIERVRMVGGVENRIPYEEMVIWMVIEGRGNILYDGPMGEVAFGVGDTVVLPAALKEGQVRIEEAAMWLELTAPIPSSLADFERPDRRTLAQPGRSSTPYVPLRIRKES